MTLMLDHESYADVDVTGFSDVDVTWVCCIRHTMCRQMVATFGESGAEVTQSERKKGEKRGRHLGAPDELRLRVRLARQLRCRC